MKSSQYLFFILTVIIVPPELLSDIYLKKNKIISIFNGQ